eukprot:TRINITY_DN29918_c0_g1_i1.p1 TRINITY_DN29918_c0_g1~~TRINITY_DN29918_c0_g1_i1.p1  ORF type:complete len:841 (+),score=137.98 TRINITY_DN29918_c0_g1_i1:3327-5849(+)
MISVSGNGSSLLTPRKGLQKQDPPLPIRVCSTSCHNNQGVNHAVPSSSRLHGPRTATSQKPLRPRIMKPVANSEDLAYFGRLRAPLAPFSLESALQSHSRHSRTSLSVNALSASSGGSFKQKKTPKRPPTYRGDDEGGVKVISLVELFGVTETEADIYSPSPSPARVSADKMDGLAGRAATEETISRDILLEGASGLESKVWEGMSTGTSATSRVSSTSDLEFGDNFKDGVRGEVRGIRGEKTVEKRKLWKPLMGDWGTLERFEEAGEDTRGGAEGSGVESGGDDDWDSNDSSGEESLGKERSEAFDSSHWNFPRPQEWGVADDVKARRADWSEEDNDMNRRFRLRNGREIFAERTFLIGVDGREAASSRPMFNIEESLEELAQLAETAGLLVVGSSYQRLDHPNPKTYIGSGKVAEVKAAVEAYRVETMVFDDELSPGQLRNLEKLFGENVRICDRTALILDIFSQRAATREATLQVELAQTEYQLPRLTRMWTHLERQAGGLTKGMGEKQIEVDKRILRTRISVLKKGLQTVREHRQQYRNRRAATPIPVASLVGYTNAGKSTLLNRLSGAGVLAEDKLFATLDPTTRRVELPGGKACLFTDTVGFIQKLPTQLVAAFRATLEEISEASLLLHVVDISHPMVEQQAQAVDQVLQELQVEHVPILSVWNKIDQAANPRAIRRLAERRGNTVCISALTGEGMDGFFDAIQDIIKTDLLVPIEVVVPYSQMDVISVIHRLGMVDSEEYLAEGTLVVAHVPLSLFRQLRHLHLHPFPEDLPELEDDLNTPTSLVTPSTSPPKAAGVASYSRSTREFPEEQIPPEFDFTKIPGLERIIDVNGL